MKDLTNELLKGIIEKLKSNIELQEIIENKIFSQIIQNTDFPYIRLQINSKNEATFDETNMAYTLRIQAFSDKKSPFEAIKIRSLIYEALNRNEEEIKIDSGQIYLCEHSGLTDCFLEDDGLVFQSIIEFNIGVNMKIDKNPLSTIKSLDHAIGLLSKGTTVKFAFYGDSQTDGNNTTGWSLNRNLPTNTDHASTAPNAFPAILEGFLQDYYENANIRCYNAGYSGQRLDNGWACDNYNINIASHTIYQDANVVFIRFGTNDAGAGDVNFYENMISEGVKLTKLIKNSGKLPVWLPPLHNWDSKLNTINTGGYSDPDIAGVENTIVMGLAIKAIQEICNKTNCEYIDLISDFRHWITNNKSSHSWGSVITDKTHANDYGHRIEASILFKTLTPEKNILNFKGEIEKINFQDSRSHFAFTDSDLGTDTAGNGHFSPHVGLLNPDDYSTKLDSPVMNIYAWINKPCKLLYRHIGHNGQTSSTAEANLPTIQVFSCLEGSLSSNSIYDKPLGGETGCEINESYSFDRPERIINLDIGLYKIVLRAPAIATDNFYINYFEFNQNWYDYEKRIWVSRQSMDIAQYTYSDALHNIKPFKPFYDLYNAPTANGHYLELPEFSDGSNVITVGQFGDSTRIYLKGRFPLKSGLILNTGKVWTVPTLGSVMTDKRYYAAMGMLFYRATTTEWDLYNIAEIGGFGTKLKDGTLLTHTTVADDQAFMIEIIKDPVEYQIIRVAETWEVPNIWNEAGGYWADAENNAGARITPSLIFKAKTDNSGKVLPFAGTIGLYHNLTTTVIDKNLYLSECYIRRKV